MYISIYVYISIYIYVYIYVCIYIYIVYIISNDLPWDYDIGEIYVVLYTNTYEFASPLLQVQKLRTHGGDLVLCRCAGPQLVQSVYACMHNNIHMIPLNTVYICSIYDIYIYIYYIIYIYIYIDIYYIIYIRDGDADVDSES